MFLVFTVRKLIRIRRLISTLLAGFLFISEFASGAVLTDWYIDHSPIYFGDKVLFNSVMEASPDQIMSYTWEWRYPGTSDWSFLSNDADFEKWQTVVGIQYIRLTVVYAPDNQGNTRPPTKISKFLEGLPPTGMRVKSGVNVNVAFGDAIDVVFVLTGGGHDIDRGGMIMWAQELFTSFDCKPITNPDGTVRKLRFPLNKWVPPEFGDNTNFRASGSSLVIDSKAASNQDYWDVTPDGDWMLKYSQKVSVKLPLSDGTSMWYEFGPFDFQYFRIDANTWQVKY